MRISTTFAEVDGICDYIPLVSFVSNAVDLFLKCVYKCLPETVAKNRYWTHIKQKDLFRCFILLIPLLGNIYVLICDYLKYKEEKTSCEQAIQDHQKWQRSNAAILAGVATQTSGLQVTAEQMMPAPKEEQQCLWTACFGNDVQPIRELLDKGISPNFYHGGIPPLVAACQYGTAEIVRLLVDAGATVTTCDRLGNSPFEAACAKGDLEKVKMLYPCIFMCTIFLANGLCFFYSPFAKGGGVRKNYFFVLLGVFFATQMYPIQSDNLQGKKIEDLILDESNAIINSEDIEDKLNAILSRAESYLLCGDDQKAISDYEKASSLIDNFEKSSDEGIYFSFRDNFGLMIAYLNENRESQAWGCYNSLRTTLEELPCNGHPSKYDNFAHRFDVDDQNDSRVLLADRPIEGPDRIPLQECLNLVNNTERFCRILISYVKHSGAQVSLHLLIDGLADSARGCCLGGGLWKACLGPLLQKWSKWDQRWQVFRLPPDPAND